MNIEKELFNRYIILPNKLLEYGFKNEDNKLVFHKKIINDTFDVIIEYENNIKGKIIELSFNEEYINFRSNIIGEYNQKIKDEFISILLDIRDNCCLKQNFIYNQSNRVNKYIEDKYKSHPEFLWPKYPSDAIYRNSKGKWFSIIMNISMNKLDSTLNDKTIIEIMNVKIDSKNLETLLKIKGIYKAYHMNKQSWITIILNDTLSDEEVFKLIDNSYNNTIK